MPAGNFISDNAWMLFVLVTVINAFSLKMRSRKIVTQRPSLRKGYDQLFYGYLVFMNIPWLVMGIGVVFGGVHGIGSFFRPRDGNLFVLAFHLTILIFLILSSLWICFKGGAEFLVKYPGVFNQNIESPWLIKAYFGLSLAVGMIGIAFMWLR